MKSLAQCTLALLFILTSAEIRAARTDVVYMNNGDRITGEVKGVYSGQLKFKTDDMGTIFINWRAIRQLISDKEHQVRLSDGSHIIGELSKVPAEEEGDQELITVSGDGSPAQLESDQVVEMYPVHGDFWDRLDVNIDLGFNYDQSSDVGKYNLGMTGRYRAKESITSARLSSELTTQDDRETTSRNKFSLVHMMDLPRKRYRSYFGNLEQNEQLGVRTRTVLGAGYGWVPVSTGLNWLTYGVGLAANLERPYGDGDSDQNLEAVGSIHYQYYRRSVPKRTIDAYLQVMPSLTQSDRVRSDLMLDFKWEIISDLYIGMETYFSYDTQPAAADASEHDFGVISKIGYSY